MSGFGGVVGFLSAVYAVISPFLAVGLLALGYWGVAVLRRHGYRTAYAEAIVRAMGAGVMAAQGSGLNPFKDDGRSVVLKVGVRYLMDNVPDAAASLGITTPVQHAARVDAQLGVAAATALAGK